MTEATTQGVLFPEFNRDECGKLFINGRCSIQRRDGFKVVTFAGMPIHYYAEGDRMSEAYAMVSLVEQGLASQKEVAQGFGFAARTVRRYQARRGARTELTSQHVDRKGAMTIWMVHAALCQISCYR